MSDGNHLATAEAGKGNDTFDLVKAVTKMSEPLLADTFPILQATGLKENEQLGMFMPYLYNFEVKQVLRNKFSFLSDSFQQSLAPCTWFKNGWS